jgi:hypothetical protein
VVHTSLWAYSLKTAGKSMGSSLEGWKISEIAIRTTPRGRVAAPILVVIASALPPSRRAAACGASSIALLLSAEAKADRRLPAPTRLTA